MPNLPVAAPDHAEIVRRALDTLAYVSTPTSIGEKETREARESLDALLTERQQDKERIERLEAALNEARPYVEWMAAGPRDAADDASTAKAVLAQVDAALTVEEDAHG